MTLAVLAEELPPASAWAEANGWSFQFDKRALEIAAARPHPADGYPLLLLGGVDGYRALPPSWRFVHHQTRQPAPEATPTRDSVNGRASVIHSPGIICAHFSRTAYRQYTPSGPHGNWQLESWDTIREGVQAHCLVEMLAVIDHHLAWSKGRLK